MPIDLAAISPARRAAFVEVGRQFGSADTLAQANRTLNAFGLHADALARHGFVEADAADLRWLRDQLVDAGVVRDATRAERKSTNAALLEGVRRAKAARRRLRSVLAQVAAAVERAGGDDAVARGIAGALAQTASVGSRHEVLAAQLAVLRGALTAEGVSALAVPRGGVEAAEDAASALGALRAAAADAKTGRGTPSETERLDLLDGLVVSLVRAARAAARSAASAQGEEAVAKAFELSELYRASPGKRVAGEEEPKPGG